jgi:hypothetical protein
MPAPPPPEPLTPDGVLMPDKLLVSDVEVVPDEDDVDEVSVVPVSALAGAATATTAPPKAARPNVKTAAVLAMRVLIMSVLFSKPLSGWLRKESSPALNETSTPLSVYRLALTADGPPPRRMAARNSTQPDSTGDNWELDS